jgi:hypothetical protein
MVWTSAQSGLSQSSSCWEHRPDVPATSLRSTPQRTEHPAGEVDSFVTLLNFCCVQATRKSRLARRAAKCPIDAFFTVDVVMLFLRLSQYLLSFPVRFLHGIGHGG